MNGFKILKNLVQKAKGRLSELIINTGKKFDGLKNKADTA